MLRRLSLLFAIAALTACAFPLRDQSPQTSDPTSAPIVRPTAAPPTRAPATATAEPQPTVAPQPTAQVTADDELARIAAARPAERDQVALAEAFKHAGAIPTVARTAPLDVKVGDVETFWVKNLINNTNYQVTARLRYAGPVVLMYVDTSVEVDQADVERSAREFEQRIYQRDHALFGHELSPGIDGDPRLTILNTPLEGAGGYFSSADSVIKAVNRFSNEREMFIIGINSYPIGSSGYGATLAHEFQHMIEWNVARRSPSWFNEGMSTLAEDLNGYADDSTTLTYLAEPDLQLTTWSDDAAISHGHYGASQLFLRYFQEQYAGEAGLAELIQADAGNHLDAFVPIAARKRPDIKSFADIYADWAVANVLNDSSVADGRYAYQLLPNSAAVGKVQPGKTVATVSQFGADYYGGLKGPLTIDFDGAETVGLTGARPQEGRAMWWSNRGDDSVETLTREFDLTGVKRATLQFSAWYELELDWDYAFVSVSTDGGKNWTTLKGNSTIDDNPQDQNFGNGLTGVSGSPGMKPDQGVRGRWLEEQMDLTPFAGRKVQLRFWVVNDTAYNAEGLLIDNIRIPEVGFHDGAEDGDGGWQAQGFARTTGELPQTWALRLIRAGAGQTTVEPLVVDERGHATAHLAAGETGLLAVIGTTPFTTEPAPYTFAVEMR
jgi:immune inhibitor A